MTHRVAMKLIVRVPANVSAADARREVQARVDGLAAHTLKAGEIAVVAIGSMKGEKS